MTNDSRWEAAEIRSLPDRHLCWIANQTTRGQVIRCIHALECASTSEVAEAIDMSYQTAWFHLNYLRKQGLVTQREEYWWLQLPEESPESP